VVPPTRGSACVASKHPSAFETFALIPLLVFCRDRELMGTLVNRKVTTVVATAVVAVILSLNVFLVYLLISGR